MSDDGYAYAPAPEPSSRVAKQPPAPQRASTPAPPTGSQALGLPQGEVLRRAIELSDGTGIYDEIPLDRRTLDEIAAELDIPSDAVAAAIAETRVGVPESASIMDRLVGPRQVWARRSADLTKDEADLLLSQWLEAGHGLQVRRRHDGTLMAVKRSDMVGKLARTVRTAQGMGQLGEVREVVAVAVDAADTDGDGENESEVVVMADLGGQRAGAIGGGVAVSGGLAAAVATGAILLGPLVLVGLPVAVGAGVATSRAVHQGKARTMQHSVEETVDLVASGEAPPGLFGPAAKSVKESISRSMKRSLDRRGRRRR